MSPYQYAANNPALLIDVNGDSIWINYYDGGNQRVYYENGKAYNADCTEYTGDNSFVAGVVGGLNKLSQGKRGSELVSGLVGSTNNVGIHKRNKNAADPNGKYVLFDPSNTTGGIDESGSRSRDPFIALGHELAHIEDVWNGTYNGNTWLKNGSKTASHAEKYATHVENLIRAEHGLSLRTHYGVVDLGGGKFRGYAPSALLGPMNSSKYFPAKLSDPLTGKSFTVPYYYVKRR